ncbi:MAG: hypothetical protein PHU04_04135 [Candidatus Peribacteraceae bacterium]|nr:hypothetical protein [Candidatus Peribacteraceae bacterium]
MTSLVFGIALSALLSVTSLLIVLLRVSPLTAPVPALTSFFLSVFLSTISVSLLLLLWAWKRVPHHTWDTGKIMSVSLREAIFLGLATVFLLLFHLFGLLTWWIALMIFGVFALVEMALLQ